jgi:UDP-galactopyranose mutase
VSLSNRPLERCSVLIVGAGLAGLSAAHHLRRAGQQPVIMVEAEDRPGGYAKTDWSGPWGADRAIHVLYFRSAEMKAWVGEMLGHAWREYAKNAIVDSGGIRTPFPFHANLHGRPADVVQECLAGTWKASLERSVAETPVTFADWIEMVHGPGVAKHFMSPYNLKQWTVPPAEMAWDWMGDFIPTPDYARILEGALRPVADTLGLNATFHYAASGASTLPEALAKRVGPIRYETRVIEIQPAEHIAVLDDGTAIRYEQMISSIPLKGLARLLAPLPEPERSAWARLESVDLVLADVGFKDAGPCDVHWAYLPDPDVLAYRLHVVHALSTDLMPPGHGLYCLEISHSRHRPLPNGRLRERVIEDLVRTRWLRSQEQVVFFRERRFKCSYVIHRVGAKQDAARLREHARRFDIHSIGRYGEWRYGNQEDSLVAGKLTAEIVAATPIPSS